MEVVADQTDLNSRVDALGAASRRAALISLIGLGLVLAALTYAFVALRSLDAERAALAKQRDSLAAETKQYRGELTSVRAELSRSRASLATSRAAINAFHAGRLNDAVALYDEALRGDPGNAYIQNLRAYSLFHLGRIDEAIAGERLSVNDDPNYAWGYFDLARFLCAATPPLSNEARQAEAKAIELRPDLQSIMAADGEFQRVRRRCGAT